MAGSRIDDSKRNFGGVQAAGNQLDEVIVTADRYDADTAQ